MPNTIAELTNVIEYAHRANQPNPFSILLLGDGFLAAEDAAFRQFVAELTNKFLEIPPFAAYKRYINVLFSSFASNNGIPAQNVEPADWHTTLGVYLSGEKLLIKNPNRVVDVLRHLQLPADLDVAPGLSRNSGDLWLNPHSKSFGAVGVVANLKAGFGESLTNQDLLESGTQPPVGTWRFFLFSMRGYQVAAGAKRDLYVHAFAHELGHSLRLYDEYESVPTSLGPISAIRGNSIRNWYQNVEFSDTMDPEPLAPTVRWRPLASSHEAIELDIGDRVYRKSRLASLGCIPNIDTLDRNVYETVPHEPGPPPKAVTWNDVYLIEGARLGRQMCRSNFECKMRHEAYDERILPDSNDPRYAEILVQLANLTHSDGTCGAAEFCRVCAHEIVRRLTGWREQKAGASVTRRELQQRFDEMMARVNRSFQIESGSAGTDLATDMAICDLASARAYIVFRQSPGLDVRFSLNTLHASLYFNGIFLDPTFYDFFRISSESGALKWEAADGSQHEFLPGETTRGMCADVIEFKNFFYFFRPRLGSFARGGQDLSAGTDDMTLRIYGTVSLWEGPDRDPDAVRTFLHYEVFPASEGDRDNAVGGVDYYKASIAGEWAKWEQYKRNGTPAQMRALDLNVPLSSI